MKRIFIFIIVGLLMFGAGFGGGLVFGRSMASGEGNMGSQTTVREPGPVVSIGQFTSNLAGSGRQFIEFTVSLEALNAKAAETISAPGWLLRIKNEILLIVKDKVFEDLTSAEGTLQFAEEIKRSLNSQLPDIKGEEPVAKVLFETLVLR